MAIDRQTLREEHSKATEELRKYKLLVDSVQDYAIFLLDSEGRIKTWNKGAQKNKGYKPEEIIGKHFSVFYLPQDIEAGKPEKELEIAKRFGRAEDEDWRLRKDGSKFWASVVITALYDDDELVGFAKVTRDISDRKHQEDELRRANALLKSQQEELRKLNQSKDDFISLASHQLRTPATAIKQLLGLYVDGIYSDLDDRHLQVLKQAYISNDRQLNIVNGLLKVAQVDAGKVKLRKAVCDVDELVQSVLNDFADTFQERHQLAEYTNQVTDPRITIDEQNIRMAVENLISNASKYTHLYGSIQVNLEEAETELTISIQDSGVGIEEKDMHVLFQKFNRLPNELSEVVGGTGLGLYWAEQIVKLHGGYITVESERGRGSLFKITLPKE